MNADLREISLNLYMDIMEKNKYIHIEMNRALDKYDYLEQKEKAFIRRLVAGSTERCISLDASINAFSKVKVKKMKPFIRNLLRMSAYQIIYMDNVADAVAVDEAVRLAKRHKFASLSGFVNAVLRNISRNKDKLELSESQKLEIPDSIYELLKSQYDSRANDICEAFLRSNDKGIILRVNRSIVADEDKLMSELGAEIVSKELGCYRLSASGNAAYLNGFSDGQFIIQDTASCLPVYMSGAKPGDNVLELCAAPGGKTIQLIDQMMNQGSVICRDISESRCEMIEEALDRCNMTIAAVQAMDARELKADDDNKYDICLVDAPCSGLGVIGSKPDIRFHFDMESLDGLYKLQREIVQAAVKAVKKGGLLVYSTCSLNKKENDEILRYANSLRKSSIIDLNDRLPECFTEYEKGDGITIFPTNRICEGFYVGALRIDE